MTTLKFNQQFSFTVCVPRLDSDSIISALNDAGLLSQHHVNVNAHALVDITILCAKGIPDAVKANSIISK